MSNGEFKAFKTSSFDFVITDKDSIPVFAVDFDGPVHEKEDKKKLDYRKLSICRKAKLPILKIGDSFLELMGKTTILNIIIDRYLLWEEEKQGLSDFFYQRGESLLKDNKTQEEIIGFIDTSCPEIEFHYKHYFNEIDQLQKVIIDKYNLYPEFLRVKNSNKLSIYDTYNQYTQTSLDGIITAYVTCKFNGILVRNGEMKEYHRAFCEEFSQRNFFRYEIANGLKENFCNDILGTLTNLENANIQLSDVFYNNIPGTLISDLVIMMTDYKCHLQLQKECEGLYKQGWKFKNDKSTFCNQYY